MTSIAIQPATDRSPAAATMVQPLNAMDCAMLSSDRVLRAQGYPDFETQAVLWCDGRLDRERLQQGLDRLAQAYPVTACRLRETGRSAPCRLMPEHPRLSLRVVSLPEADDAAVYGEAARLLSEHNDPGRTDPLRFHLLELPGGRDVLVMQYTHLLMDNNAAIPVLRLIDHLAAGGDVTAPDEPSRDVLCEHLQRQPWRRRMQAALRVLDLRYRRLRGLPVTLGHPRADESQPVDYRMTSRTIDSEVAGDVTARVREICGFPSMSMAVLASAFRGLAAHTNRAHDPRANFVAGIGVDLGLRGRRGPLFRNLMSVVPMNVRGHDLDDRDALVRQLSFQFRDKLKDGIDVGVLQLARFLSTRPKLGDRVMRRLICRGYSLWYAHFGALDGVGERFCGAGVENLVYTAPTWAPLGLTLLVSQFRGRMTFQATYLPDSVARETADAFLNTLVADLPRR